MNEATWDRVKQVFHDAMARPLAERYAFLDEACADDAAVRSEVEGASRGERRHREVGYCQLCPDSAWKLREQSSTATSCCSESARGASVSSTWPSSKSRCAAEWR